MSVSMLETPVPASSTSGFSQVNVKPEAKVSREAPSAPSFKGQNATNVNFQWQENKGGPLFGSGQSPAVSTDVLARHPNVPAKQNFLDRCKHWFAGHRPPMHPGCNNPPPRPNPGCSNPPPRPNPGCNNPPPRPNPGCYTTLPWPNPGCSNPPPRPNPGCNNPPSRPDPCNSRPPVRPTPCHGGFNPEYSTKSNDDLAKMLLDQFDAFKPGSRGYITTQDISNMAGRQLTGDPSQDRPIRLARELMSDRRRELVNAMDRHSTTGALDGIIDQQKIRMTLSSQSPLKYYDDWQLADDMLQHFDQLKDPRNPQYISIEKLRGLAQWPTSDPVHGRLAWIAQEVLKRSQVKDGMDGGDAWGKDEWIHIDTLRRMSPTNPRR